MGTVSTEAHSRREQFTQKRFSVVAKEGLS